MCMRVGGEFPLQTEKCAHYQEARDEAELVVSVERKKWQTMRHAYTHTHTHTYGATLSTLAPIFNRYVCGKQT